VAFTYALTNIDKSHSETTATATRSLRTAETDVFGAKQCDFKVLSLARLSAVAPIGRSISVRKNAKKQA
jgi:hypothetical protein